MRFGVLLAAVGLVLAACGTGDEAADSPVVVATTTIVADIVSNVVGEDVEIEVLMPLGADPHDYQASASQVAAINEADVVFANGLDLEEGLLEVLEAAEGDGVTVVRLGDGLDPLPFSGAGHSDHEEGEDSDHSDHEEGEEADHEEGEGSDHSDHEEGEEADHEEGEEAEHEEEGSDHDHDEDGLDPHFWLDPVRVADAALLVAAEMERLYPETDWSAAGDTYAAEMMELDADIRVMLESIAESDRKLVTNHEALGYFADRYEFEVVGVVIPGGSTLADPSSRHLAELVETIEHEGVPAIFVDLGQGTDLAEAVAAEAAEPVAVVELYTGSLGEPGSDTGTLAGMLEHNAAAIGEVLG